MSLKNVNFFLLLTAILLVPNDLLAQTFVNTRTPNADSINSNSPTANQESYDNPANQEDVTNNYQSHTNPDNPGLNQHSRIKINDNPVFNNQENTRGKTNGNSVIDNQENTSTEPNNSRYLANEKLNRDENQQNISIDLKNGLNSLANNNWTKAINDFNQVLKYDKNNYEAINLKGIAYLRSGNLNDAHNCFLQCLNLNPNYQDALDNIASVLARSNNYQAALVYFLKEKSLAQNPDANLLVNIADCYLALNNDTQALNYCNLAIAKNSANAFNLRGWIYFKQGNYDLALNNINHAIELKPNYALAYYHLGEIQRALNDKEKALEAYKTSLKFETNPKYSFDTRQTIKELQAGINPVNSLGLGSNNPTEPIRNSENTDFTNTVKLKPNVEKAIALNNVAYGYFLQKNYNLALDIFKQALETADFISGNCNLASVYLSLKDYNNAKKYYTKALLLARANKKVCPVANLGLGVVFDRTGDLPQAIDAYKLAIAQSDSHESIAYYNLAVIYIKQNKLDEANNYLSKYKILCPDDKYGIELLTSKIKTKMILSKH